MKQSSQTKKIKKTTQDHEKIEIGDNGPYFEYKKYRCGVCKVVRYNRNDFQVRFTSPIKILELRMKSITYDIILLFINLIYYTFQDHIAVHKPKTYLSNLALGGESSGFDVENSIGLSDMAFATGYQVNILNTKDIQNK